MNNGQSDDLVSAGFHRIDEKALPNHPPKISWGPIYQGKSDREKIIYLEKLSEAMNHAAFLIQNERNELTELCALKEAQLETLTKAMEANNEMIQQEVTRMNADRQNYNQAIKELNEKVRELENDSHD